jgi:hypothetical protein
MFKLEVLFGADNYLVGQEGLEIGTALGILYTWNQVLEMRETFKTNHYSL